MTPREYILMAGWSPMKLNAEVWPEGKLAFEKGNYWLFLDERRFYKKDSDYVELMVRDPSAHMTSVGDDRSMYFFTFLWKGPETIEHINQLLPE